MNEKKTFSFELPALLGKEVIKVNLNRFVGFCDVKNYEFQSALCFDAGNVLDTVDMKGREEALDMIHLLIFHSIRNYSLIIRYSMRLC